MVCLVRGSTSRAASRITVYSHRAFERVPATQAPCTLADQTPTPSTKERRPSPVGALLPISEPNAALPTPAPPLGAHWVAYLRLIFVLALLSPSPGWAPAGSPVSWPEKGNTMAAPLFSLIWERNIPGTCNYSLCKSQ